MVSPGSILIVYILNTFLLVNVSCLRPLEITGCQAYGKSQIVGPYKCFENGVCNGTDLQYLPPLPDGTTKLFLASEGKSYLFPDQFFTNVTSIVELCFKGEHQVTFGPKALLPLKKLTALYISVQQLNMSSILSRVSSVKTLTTLALWHMSGSVHVIPDDIFVRYPMPELKELSLVRLRARNGTIDLSVFSPLKQLRILNFTQSAISDISNASSLSKLERMDLTWNKFRNISLAQFSHFKNLMALNISQNNITAIIDTNSSTEPTTFYQTSPSLNSKNYSASKFTTETNLTTCHMPELKILDISHNLLSRVTNADCFPNLEELYASFNQVLTLNLEEVSPMTRLKRVDISRNKLTGDISPDYMLNLEVLDLQQNKISGLPETCGQGGSYFPKLQIIDLTDNLVLVRKGELCLPKLTTLLLGKNEFTGMDFSFFDEEHFPDFITLDLSYQRGLHAVYDMGLKTALQAIDLSFNNNLYFNLDVSVRVKSFEGCVKLKALNLSHTSFEGVGPQRFQLLFGNLTKLQHLSLRVTSLTRVTASMFRTLTSLQVLDLSGNSLYQLPDKLFLRTPFLTSLNASYNQIATIKGSTFPLSTRLRLQQVDLSANPFVCSCDLLWFRQWLKGNPLLFQHSIADYMCENLPGSPVQTFFIQEQTCLLSEASVKEIITASILLMFAMIMITLTYHYRWHIRLKLYNAFRNQRDRQRRLEEQNFRYDVFVSFDSQDADWVLEHLIPELEGRLGLRLCLHFRDFIPGKPVVENIMECMESSKKMMMIFSKDFAESHWCQFELQVCLTHAMDNEDALLVVLLHEIPSRDLTLAMTAVMKTTTYIEWPGDPDGRSLFWGRVHLALSEILPGR